MLLPRIGYVEASVFEGSLAGPVCLLSFTFDLLFFDR